MNLTENDVVVIMNTLVYDGLVDDVEEDGIDVYRLARRAPVVSALGSIPCGVCPVIHQCAPDGPVSPATCEYFKAWLEF